MVKKWGRIYAELELSKKRVFLSLDVFMPRRNSHTGSRPPHLGGFMITLRHTTLGRPPLDE